ncbi:MAG: hypothetical protein M3279_07450 [Actinomycetota bacterium]|nr:hypothetical protein [Actinomycetota bacterium]MDQ3952780.1 hypothetical protein [Actinomycetota bacterium]
MGTLLVAAFAGLALLRLATLRLDSPLGRLRDGLLEGMSAPEWELRDTTGRPRRVPHGSKWQLLVFGDYTLVEFPGVVAALQRLEAQRDELEILLLSRVDENVTVRTAQALKLDVPVVSVDDDLYWRYNVRVMPFVFVVQPDGIVRSSGVVSAEEVLLNMWRLARVVPLEHAGANA